MKSFFPSLLLLVCFIASPVTSATPYERIQLEPYSVIEGRHRDTDPASRWSISIYIIFGKRDFKPQFNNNDQIDPVCGSSMCVRAIGICIQIGKESKGLLEGIGREEDQIWGQLNSDQQKIFIDSFFDVFTSATVQDVNYASLENRLNLPTERLGDVGFRTQAPMQLGRNSTFPWNIILQGAELIVYTEQDQIKTQGSGLGDGQSLPSYAISGGDGNIVEIVPYENCNFNRWLLKLYYCSRLFYNRFLCWYYSRLIAGNVLCGGELKTGLRRPSPWEAFIKFLKWLRELIDIIFG